MKDLAESREVLNKNLKNETGVAGFGISEDRLICFLEQDSPKVREFITARASQLIGDEHEVYFEVTGEVVQQE
jgi:hypothetical protein